MGASQTSPSHIDSSSTTWKICEFTSSARAKKDPLRVATIAVETKLLNIRVSTLPLYK